MQEKENLKDIVKRLPEKPGVYQFFNKQGTIIYIGKAKKLKNRVSSYFNKDTSMSGKVRIMVQKIARIEHIIVNSEFDALLLENTLIKKHRPRYNIMLKDDKTYPWIVVKNEPFPRIFSTRHYIHDGSEYFGPYASVKMMNTLLDMIYQLYKLRTCKYNLTPANIKSKKYKICLSYHIHKCAGPCEGKQDEADYLKSIQEIKQILKGNIHSVKIELQELMNTLSANYEFEKAQIVKEKIQLLNRYQSKSLVVNDTLHNIDVFSYTENNLSAFVNYLKIIHGAVIHAHTLEIKKKLDESKEELLEMAITEIRSRFDSDSPEIIVPFLPENQFPSVKYFVPKIGDKKKLLELSERNAIYYKLEQQKNIERTDPERHTKRILAQMKEDLHLQTEPIRIECFDNSNIQGAFPVAAMSVFVNAKPAKEHYRKFNIKTVSGPNDYASMQEVIYRRYKRLLDEGHELPQLIIVDGGKGQLSSALESLKKLDLVGKVAIIGIAERLEEIYFPNDSVPLYINKKSETLKVIQQIRDEAHRFGVTFHRSKREKAIRKTELTEIKGIGGETAQKLLLKFRSVINIKNASKDELEAVVGKAKAEILIKYFSGK